MADDETIYALSYHGEIVDGGAEGFGTMKYSNGAEYTGLFRNDQPDGHSIINYPDGAMYAGAVRDGNPHGHGVYFHPRDEHGSRAFQVGYWDDVGAAGMVIFSHDISRTTRKEFHIVKEGEIVGKGMIATLGPGNPNSIVPTVFEMIDGERKPVPEEQLTKFQRDRISDLN